MIVVLGRRSRSHSVFGDIYQNQELFGVSHTTYTHWQRPKWLIMSINLSIYLPITQFLIPILLLVAISLVSRPNSVVVRGQNASRSAWSDPASPSPANHPTRPASSTLRLLVRQYLLLSYSTLSSLFPFWPVWVWSNCTWNFSPKHPVPAPNAYKYWPSFPPNRIFFSPEHTKIRLQSQCLTSTNPPKVPQWDALRGQRTRPATRYFTILLDQHFKPDN